MDPLTAIAVGTLLAATAAAGQEEGTSKKDLLDIAWHNWWEWVHAFDGEATLGDMTPYMAADPSHVTSFARMEGPWGNRVVGDQRTPAVVNPKPLDDSWWIEMDRLQEEGLPPPGAVWQEDERIMIQNPINGQQKVWRDLRGRALYTFIRDNWFGRYSQLTWTNVHHWPKAVVTHAFFYNGLVRPGTQIALNWPDIQGDQISGKVLSGPMAGRNVKVFTSNIALLPMDQQPAPLR